MLVKRSGIHSVGESLGSSQTTPTSATLHPGTGFPESLKPCCASEWNPRLLPCHTRGPARGWLVVCEPVLAGPGILPLSFGVKGPVA